MAFADIHRRQVGLLIRTLPLVAQEQCFALKGGTAINLFIRNMPRISVDVDLTYLPVQPRSESLAAIDAAMKRTADHVRAGIQGAKITEGRLEGALTRLLVRAEGVPVSCCNDDRSADHFPAEGRGTSRPHVLKACTRACNFPS